MKNWQEVLNGISKAGDEDLRTEKDGLSGAVAFERVLRNERNRLEDGDGSELPDRVRHGGPGEVQKKRMSGKIRRQT